MTRFAVGDGVSVAFPGSPWHGRRGTIVDIKPVEGCGDVYSVDCGVTDAAGQPVLLGAKAYLLTPRLAEGGA